MSGRSAWPVLGDPAWLDVDAFRDIGVSSRAGRKFLLAQSPMFKPGMNSSGNPGTPPTFWALPLPSGNNELTMHPGLIQRPNRVCAAALSLTLASRCRI